MPFCLSFHPLKRFFAAVLSCPAEVAVGTIQIRRLSLITFGISTEVNLTIKMSFHRAAVGSAALFKALPSFPYSGGSRRTTLGFPGDLSSSQSVAAWTTTQKQPIATTRAITTTEKRSNMRGGRDSLKVAGNFFPSITACLRFGHALCDLISLVHFLAFIHSVIQFLAFIHSVIQ
jgi:hypothetical protein